MAQSFATEIAKERFYDQMERYRNLNDSLDLPAAVIPLYLAAILFFTDRLIAFYPAIWGWHVVVVIYVAFFVASVASAVFVIWAAWGYCRTIWCYQDATDLPSPQALDEWLREMAAAIHGPDEAVEAECEPGLREDYVTAAETTFRQNEARSRRMFYCRRHLVMSFVLTAVAMVGYYSVERIQAMESKTNGTKTTQASSN